MWLLELMKSAMENRDSGVSTPLERPVFEFLEPRLLLSADGLETIQLDPFHSSFDLASAIEVDIEYGQEQPASVIEATQEQETVSSKADLVVGDSEDGSNGIQEGFETSLTTLENTSAKLSEVGAIEVAVDTGLDSQSLDSSIKTS